MINNNGESLLKQIFTSGDTIGLATLTDVSGTTRYLADYSSYPATVEETFTTTAASAGISVGSGTTAPAKTDYQLATPITSGLTGSVLSERSTDTNGNPLITFTVTITNTSNSDITISEIGYKQELAASDASEGTTATDRVFLIDRSVFDSITLASNESAVLEYRLKSVITNNGGHEGSKSITSNGTYNAVDDDLDGYSSISVNVPPNVGTKSITTNGTYNASTDSYDGYSSVTVSVSPNVAARSITTNGTYNASSDDLDGYSSVTVLVSPNVGTKSITANGNYNASSDSLDGYSSVSVSVAPNVGSKSITANGTYTASSESLDGYSSVIVSVSGGGGGAGTTYNIVTKSTSGNDAAITVNKYVDDVLVSSTDYIYTLTYPITIDNRISLDYGNLHSLEWTYTLLEDSVTHNTNYSKHWGYGDTVEHTETFNSSTMGTKTITTNGTYSAQDDNYDGYSEVTVSVSGGGGREDVLATAIMTSDTTPSGAVTASSYYAWYYAPWYAFSQSCGIDQYTWVSNIDDVIGAWIQYELPQAEKIVKLVTINRGEANTRAVKTFIFQGSNDGTTWTNIQTCNIASNTSFYKEEFLINNDTAYLYYRLYITAAHETNPRWVGFAQIQMYKECVTSAKSITQNGTYLASNDNLGGYSQVLVNVGSGISKDITSYEFVTKSTGNQDASITIKKYFNGVLQSTQDFGYSGGQHGWPYTIDDLIVLDYGQTAGYCWTYKILRDSKKHETNYSYSWSFGEWVDVTEVFADFLVSSKTITENGIYYASGDELDGYSHINVSVNTGLRQINPFPSGATTLSLYNSNGITVNSSSISFNGTASMNFTEAQAGYEGFVIELNVTAGSIYIVEFDYQNISAAFWENPPYMMGWLLGESAKTDYSSYGQWIENIARDSLLHHYAGAIVPNGNKIYMNFNVCGYSDARTNTAEITNLKVYEVATTPSSNSIFGNAQGITLKRLIGTSTITATAELISNAEEVV